MTVLPDKQGFQLLFRLSGLLLIVSGFAGLMGWILEIPFLVRFNPDWKPMVPATAFCFALSGFLFIGRFKFSTPSQRRFAGTDILLIVLFLVAGARGLEILLGTPALDVFSTGVWGWFYRNHGQMSNLTTLAFLIFGTAVALIRWAPARFGLNFGRLVAALLLILGVSAVLGYGVQLPYLFEGPFLDAGVIWLSLPTSIGILFLGLGLLSGTNPGQSQEHPSEVAGYRVGRIYRATIFVVVLISLSIGLLGVNFLENATLNQSRINMMQALDAKQSYLFGQLEDYVQRAQLASSDPALMSEVAAQIENIRHRISGKVKGEISSRLLQHGFTGVALDVGPHHLLIAGAMLHDTKWRLPLKWGDKGGEHISLLWNQGYFLSVRIPMDMGDDGVAKAYLVIEEAMPHVGRMIQDANHWGKSGTLPMCGRLDETRLLCFPQREQEGMYIIPDDYDGQPIAMALALSGERGAAVMVDYRGRHVLAAYSPVGDTGLALVLKMNLSEVYAPVRNELSLLIPLILLFVLLGPGLVYLRVRPLLQALSRSHDEEMAARSRFEAAMESSPDSFSLHEAVRDEKGHVIDFVQTYANKNAHAQEVLLGNLNASGCDVEPFSERTVLVETCRSVFATGENVVSECSWLDAENQRRWYIRQIVAMPTGVAVTFRDVTEEKRLFQALEYSNKLRTAIVEGAAYALISTDEAGTILSFNQAAERMLMFKAEELVGRATPAVFHDDQEIRERAESLSLELGRPIEPGFDVFVAKAKTQAHEDREWTYLRKDGFRFPVRLSVTALRGEDDAINGYLGIAYDISEQKRAEAIIKHAALHDALTGLPNRVLLEDRVNTAIEQQRRNGTPFVLAMMDVDHFKQINDTKGHHVGDLVLKEFVARVLSCLRLTDTLARMGGDEFVLLLPDTNPDGGELVITRIKASLSAPIDAAGREVHVSSSMGISVCPANGMTMDELLGCADEALYWVKEHGRKGYRFYEGDAGQGTARNSGLEREPT